jgi:hypothetical protein
MSAEKYRQRCATHDDAKARGCPTPGPRAATWILFVQLASGHWWEIRRPFALAISLPLKATPAASPLPSLLISVSVVFSLRAPPTRLSAVRGPPTCLRRLARDLSPARFAQGRRPGIPTPSAKHHGGRVFLDPTDVNGVACPVGGASWALWSSRHSC